MERAGPVVLLTVDTLRADRFTEACFPECFPTFERDFARFANARSHGNATPLAFPALVTSYPVVGDGEFPPEATTLAERFDGPCSGFSNNAHLTERRGYHRGFDRFHDLAPPDSRSPVERLKRIETLRNSRVVVGAYRALKRLKGIHRPNKEAVVDPFPNPKTTADVVSAFVERRVAAGESFVWGHYMDPHKPFHPDQAVDGPTTDRTREEIKYLNSYEHSKDPLPEDDLAFLGALYDSNVRYLDRELKALFDRLRDRGAYDDATIIVVGDHGELFGEHGLMFHPMDVDPVDELIDAPLLVKYPGNEHGGRVFDHLVQHADVVPTVEEVAGAATAPTFEGVRPLTDQSPRRVISKSNVSIRLTEPSGVAFKRRDGTREGYDDVSEEGRELLDAAEFPAVRTTSGEVKGVEDAGGPADLDAERERQLEALGYK